MFDFQSPQSRCARCGRLHRHAPDIDALIADGRLRIAADVPDEIAERIVADYFAGRWGMRSHEHRDRLPDFAEIGRFLMATYEVCDIIYHILTNHGNSITEIVMEE